MLFCYVHIKDRHDPRSKYQSNSKHSKLQQSWGALGWGDSEFLNRDFRGHSPLGKHLGHKEHLHWLKKDLNAVKIITVQDYKHTKNNVN